MTRHSSIYHRSHWWSQRRTNKIRIAVYTFLADSFQSLLLLSDIFFFRSSHSSIGLIGTEFVADSDLRKKFVQINAYLAMKDDIKHMTLDNVLSFDVHCIPNSEPTLFYWALSHRYWLLWAILRKILRLRVWGRKWLSLEWFDWKWQRNAQIDSRFNEFDYYLFSVQSKH